MASIFMLAITKNMNRIKQEKIFEEKITRSRFIVHTKYVEDVKEAKDYISHISKEHQNASHNCWAYVIGKKGEYAHSSDNGEPSGTAGKPMLNALHKFDLTNIVVIVTRYFGGVKLGIRGLIDAYGGVVERSIIKNNYEELVDYLVLEIELNYDYKNIFDHKLKKFEIKNIDIEYDAKIKYIITLKESVYSQLLEQVTELENNKKLIIIR